MDKPITTIILALILAMFITVAVACNQPIEEDVVAEPTQTQSEATYKVIPFIAVHEDDIDIPETESVTEEATEPPVTIVETKSEITYGIPMTLTATAYCPCVKCCGKNDGITATGTKATAGRTIAVDPRVIPYGSKVIINGNTYIAEDCGGAIKSNRIDIFFDTHQEAREWGRRTVEALVVMEVTK